MARGPRREVGEQERLIDVGERIVKQERVRARGEGGRLGADRGRRLVLAAEPLQQAARGGDLPSRLVDGVDLEREQLA